MPDASKEILLVLDAATGQNAVNQARQFSEVTDITGIVLTKLDGTAKGGFIISLSRELEVPVCYVGDITGEDITNPVTPTVKPNTVKCDINAVNVVILQNILNGNFSNFLIKGHPRTGVPTMSIERQLTKSQFV